MADPATAFFTMRIPVRPVHQAALAIPLENAAESDPVAHTDRDAPGQVEVVSNQQGLAPGQLQDESLMPGATIVVRDKPHDIA